MTRVFKLGGRAQGSSDLVTAIAGEWARGRRDLCIVHGGGDEISALQRALGIEPVFVGGRRATTERDLDLVRMALSGAANKRLVSQLADAGVPAWGLSGEDAGVLQATPLSAEFGFAGSPSQVEPAAIQLILERGYLPIISPVARNASGSGALNVNGDDAAAAIAGALGARELAFVSDVAGVAGSGGGILSHLTVEEALELVAAGVATAGMAAKLQAAGHALAAGVARVRIGGVEMINDSSAGSAITSAAREALV